jgi:hypothetical protein
MVLRAMNFTPEVLLSAPRRSAGIPNAWGTKILSTTSTYNFKTHSKTTKLNVLMATGGYIPLATNEDLSDFSWLDEKTDTFICLQANADGTTSVCIGDASIHGWPPDHYWKPRHYIAGTIDAAAGNLKVAKLDDEGEEFAFVVSAQAAKDGSLFNASKAQLTHSTGRLYKGLYVRHWDKYEVKEKNALW